MNKSITCLAAAGLMGLAPVAMADTGNTQNTTQDTQETRFYIAPMASYNMPDDDAWGADDQLGGRLSIGKNFGDFFAAEVYGFYYDDMDLGHQYGANANADNYGLGVSALFFPARDLLPVYALVGVGIGTYDFDASNTGLNNQDTTYYDVGVGYMFPLNDYGVKLRAEYRYRSSNVDMPSGSHADVRNNIVSIGIQVPLSAPAQAETPQPAPAPAPVQPSDSDGDGVIDPNDQCPATPRGTQVNASGCPVEKKAPVVLRGVTFAFDSAELTQQAQTRLNNVIAALEASQEVRFSIAGHTDAVGPASYNQGLSERRAQSVKTYLVGHGISESRITRVVGYGEARPVATNETAAGRAQNRRVELNVTEQ